MRCFSSLRCLRRPMYSADASIRLRMDGFPIRRFPGQGLFGSFPRLIAAFRVLLRLLAPRHPPYALSSLTAIPITDGPERRRRDELRALSSRLKIKRVCATSHYSVFKERSGAREGRRSVFIFPRRGDGGDERARTANLRLAKPALSQLSYVPRRNADGRLQIAEWTNSGKPAFGIRKPASGDFDGGPKWSRTNDLVLIRDAL